MNELKTKAKELLTSEKGLEDRSKRPVEALFGQVKSNKKFNKFTFKGLEKAEMKFLLMALGHNFRKMVAKGTISSKVRLKIAKRESKIVLKIEIYEFKPLEKYFQHKKLVA